MTLDLRHDNMKCREQTPRKVSPPLREREGRVARESRRGRPGLADEGRGRGGGVLEQTLKQLVRTVDKRVWMVYLADGLDLP